MKMDVGKGWAWWWWVWSTFFIWMLEPTSSFCPPLCSCDDATLLTDCHEAGNLKMVPIFLNPQTKFLSLAQNQIKEISMSLHFYSELQLLDFSQNQIEGLGGNNFENLRNLKVLNISYNSIRQLESDAFSGLRQTVVVDLSVNQIETIDPDAFRGLVALREIHLDRNRLEILNWDWFSELLALERLTLRFNFIRILQPPHSYSPFLLFFNNSSTTELSSSMRKRNGSESEKVLPLTSVSRTPAAALSPNSIPATPWSLRNVVEVDLSWNQLAAVRNYGLSPLLPSLRKLNLCCNYIHTVEEDAFSGIQQLHLQKSAGAIGSVNLSQNRLTSIPSDALEKLGSSLVELDLSSNRIQGDLPPSAFRSLFQLRKLSLSENPGIRSIDSNALLDNIHLVVVEANHLSNLTEFPVGIFNNKPYLRVMSLQFGSISTLPQELFTTPIYSSLLSALDLFGNPIDCNCTAWRLFEYVVKEERLNPMDPLVPQSQLQEENMEALDGADKKKVPLGSIQCAWPPNLQQFKIRDLTQSDFEQCFDQSSFSTDHFELLVILLSAFIVFLIIFAVGVKLCCLYRLCPTKKQRKDIGLPSGKENGTTLDEFCSNVCGNNGSVTTTTTTSTLLGGKILPNGLMNGYCRDYRAPIPPSPALSSKSKKNSSGTLPVNGFTPHPAARLDNGHGYGHPTLHRSPRNTNTLGPPHLPLPYDYEEDEGYLPYATINPPRQQPSPATLNYSNKLRFNPKMQLVLDSDDSESNYANPRPPHAQAHHAPPILYEYDYPDYRNNHSKQRVKQVPSVLV